MWPMLACASGQYASVDGLRIYYEIHGTATEGTLPLLLLHGGGETIETSFNKTLPSLSSRRMVIAIEQQGHGHTADLERPFSYERFADDTAGVLKHAGMQRVDCFGWSDGGKIGLMLAMRHPEMVRKLMVSGSNFRQDGLTDAAIKWLKDTKPGDADLAESRAAYEKVAPDPKHWDVFAMKWTDFYISAPDWTTSQLGAIRAHVLVMIGDNEGVRLEHAQELRRAIPNSRLAVLPGTGHATLLQRPEWVVSILEDFLAAPMPKAP
ncbi:MAG TPA: alpha/beta hydrolase [Steroidobacteraceae bacterium]|nr:alpha/beta hydrolase [Steroidobacteraceae bacterium]